jgi:hypothetical protein
MAEARRRWLALTLALVAVPGLSAACGSEELMEKLRAESPPEHRWYEAVAIQTFVGEDGELAQCAATARVDEPRSFDFLIHVLPGGVLSFPLAVPETEVAKCIRERTRNRLFPSPPGDAHFVARVTLTVESDQILSMATPLPGANGVAQ